MENLQITFSVEQSPEQVFAAIKNVHAWWGEGIVGNADEYTYRHKDIHLSKQRLTEAVPGKKLVWLVTEGHLSFVEKKTEWTGTELVFELARNGDRTEVHFTHVGLKPECECFDACSKGWGFYVGRSLRRLIETGTGEPDPSSVAA